MPKKPNILKKFRPTSRDRTDFKKRYIDRLQGDTVYCLGCGMAFEAPLYQGMFAHHTLPVEKFPELFEEMERFGVSVIQPLCFTCHNKVHWALHAYRKLKGKPF